VHEVPSGEVLRDLYARRDYYDLAEEAVERIREENRRRLKAVAAMKNGCKLLDIGCARGLLLDEAARIGFDVEGIELSDQNAAICRKNGHRVYCGDVQTYLGTRGQEEFDVITCLDVIEHVETPAGLLLALTALLKDDGIVVISTPNYSGLVAKCLGARDPYLTPPEHLNFFTVRGLRALCQSCGLAEIHWVTFGRPIFANWSRSVDKYLGGTFRPLGTWLKGIAPLGFKMMNRLLVGMELEMYLRKRPPTQGDQRAGI
jgi:2-polyprenyl-3-methyl-5-hydroxy-6-metoxy-1,4-benzoquinol methylase